MAISWVNCEIIGYSISERSVGECGCENGVEAGGEHRSGECLSPVLGIENPDVNCRTTIGGEASIRSVKCSVRGGPHHYELVERAVIVSARKFHRGREVCGLVGGTR